MRLVPIALFLLVLVASLVATFISRPIAFRFELIDAPAGLKIHNQTKARFGGFGIFVGLIIGVLLLPARTHPLLLGATVMWLIGAIDDRLTIKSLQKLAGQIFAGIILAYTIFMQNPGPTGVLYGCLGCLGAVVFANAVNLIDGMDGLAGGNAFLIFIGFAVLSKLHGLSANLPLVVAAAILGFMPFNFPKARLFMGDSGSLLLGFLIAYMLVTFLITSPLLLVSGLIVAALPIYDLSLGVLRRVIGRHPVFSADRNHFYDRLDGLIHNMRVTVLLTYAITLLCLVVGVLLSYASLLIAALGFVTLFVVLLGMSACLGWFQPTVQSKEA